MSPRVSPTIFHKCRREVSRTIATRNIPEILHRVSLENSLFLPRIASGCLPEFYQDLSWVRLEFILILISSWNYSRDLWKFSFFYYSDSYSLSSCQDFCWSVSWNSSWPTKFLSRYSRRSFGRNLGLERKSGEIDSRKQKLWKKIKKKLRSVRKTPSDKTYKIPC